MNNKKNDLLAIVSQAFYGNRTGTEIREENIDRFILGYQTDYHIPETKPIDRTIINVPNTDNIVIIYNKYQEQRELQRKKELLENENYELKPLVIIPENGIELYSRAIVCRMENGELKSLENEDYGKFMRYLSE